MPKIAIVVEYNVKQDHAEPFLAHIRDHAAKSLAEPGCERFDVLQPRGSGKVMLFELYRDEAAFDAHRTDPRMGGVRERAAPMLHGQTITVCEVS